MSVARRSHPSLIPRNWWRAAGDTNMAGPLARFAAFLARGDGVPSDPPRIECVVGSDRQNGAENALRAFLLFADRVFASADMAIALKLQELPDQEDNPAHIAPALADDMRQRTPTPEPKGITSNEMKGVDDGETLLDEALGCHEWDGSIDADKLAHIARAHDAAALNRYLDQQVFAWSVFRTIHVVEVCGDRNDAVCPKRYRSAYLRCNNSSAWWLAAQYNSYNCEVFHIAAPMPVWLTDAVVDVFISGHRHGFVGPSWPRDAPIFGWTSGWLSRVANLLCCRSAVAAGAWTPALVDTELQLARSLLAMSKRRRFRPDASTPIVEEKQAQAPLAAILGRNSNDISFRTEADYQVTRDVAQKTATEDMLRTFVVCLDRLQRTPAVFELVTKPYEAARLAELRAGDKRLVGCSSRFLADIMTPPEELRT